jgi:hypothetical protein
MTCLQRPSPEIDTKLCLKFLALNWVVDLGLTDKASGTLLRDFYTERSWCNRFIAVAVYGNTFSSVKQFVGPTIVLPFGILAGRTLVTLDGKTCGEIKTTLCAQFR